MYTIACTAMVGHFKITFEGIKTERFSCYNYFHFKALSTGLIIRYVATMLYTYITFLNFSEYSNTPTPPTCIEYSRNFED